MIYIGIPVRDERYTIGPLLWRIRELLTGGRRDFRVIVCEDGSSDGTREALEPYTRILPLTILEHDRPRGYAACLERLVREAIRRSSYTKRDALVTLQGDFTDSPEVVLELVRRFEGGADLVTTRGSRPYEGARRWVQLGARYLARPATRCEAVADPFSSLRLYRLFTLERALADVPREGRLLEHDGWAANTELLARVWPHVRRTEEVPAETDFSRRYRESRFRAWPQLHGMMSVSRHAVVRDFTASRPEQDEG